MCIKKVVTLWNEYKSNNLFSWEKLNLKKCIVLLEKLETICIIKRKQYN